MASYNGRSRSQQQNQPTQNSCNEPKGLTVPLMPHQKDALDWMLQQEDAKASGGLLADDMGLGKTLSIISLIVKSQEKGNYQKSKLNTPSGGTLIVCPLSLMDQWKSEIEKKTEKGILSVEIYHGPKRNKNTQQLAQNKVVLTTYGIVCNEINKAPLFTTNWRRVVLDEAHKIKNPKSKTATAVFELSAKSRWALTGTPIHNTKDDLYSYFKFLRYSPYDDIKNWETLIQKGDESQMQNLLSEIMFRRTKNIIPHLPEKTVVIVDIQLDESEKHVYEYVRSSCSHFSAKSKSKQSKPCHIFVLLLLLRQICCHPYLITQKLPKEEEDFVSENSQDSLQKLSILEEFSNKSRKRSQGTLDLSDPVFNLKYMSSKIKHLISLLENIVCKHQKAIVVSQWTSFLDLIALHIKSANIKFDCLTGKTENFMRTTIVKKFNDPKTDTQVLLLSLTAGGVGLNLVGANHLFLMDLHWNPQLEKQAEDRIHRIGQEKPVFIYKFITTDTIEERIKDLQDDKLKTAKSFLGLVESDGIKPRLEELQQLLEQLILSNNK